MKELQILKKRRPDGHILTLISLMAAVCLLMLILNPGAYYTAKNFRSMVFQFPEYGILAFGMMFAMISGGIDLSLVGIMNLSGVTAALILLKLVPEEAAASSGQVVFALFLAIIAAIAVGAFCGFLNGVIIGRFGLPAMLVTLCTLQIFNGLVNGITGGPALNGMCSAFQKISNGTIPGIGIPWVLLIFITVLGFSAYILKFTLPGHEIYYQGAGFKAAVYSGIATFKNTVICYMLSGIMGGISGVLITSHLNSAKASNGASYTLLTLLVVVLGGVHPDGGKGKLLGVTLSILLMQLISNAFTIMHVSQEAKNFANGCLLIAALLITEAVKKKREKQ